MTIKLYCCKMFMGGFCSTDKEWIQKEVDYRNENAEGRFDKARMEEIEVNCEDVGLCWNSFPKYPENYLTTKKQSQCSVGMVRSMRMEIPEENDSGCCDSCSYFLSMNEIDNLQKKRRNDIIKEFNIEY